MPYNVLIVDDDRIFRSEFHEILKYEYNVFEAASGAEAVEIIKKPNMIDLVMLDVKMPGLPGTEILKQLKQLQPALTIVILTGFASKNVIVESLRKHADDFLEKPIKIEPTLRLIRELLSHKQTEAKGSIERLKYFVEKNFHKGITLQQASTVVCLSPKYVSKIFKEETGIGFNQYKLKLKMDKAKEFLGTSSLNISEIAAKIGYQNVESFVRIFKSLEGSTPSAYRRKTQNRRPE